MSPAITAPAADAVLVGQLREIYDAYRTAHYNRRYNEARLATVATKLTSVGVRLFAPLAATQLTQLRDEHARYVSLVTAYCYHGLVLRDLVNRIHNTRTITPESLTVFSSSVRQLKELELDDDEVADAAIAEESYQKVLREISSRGLWMPKVDEGAMIAGIDRGASIHATRVGMQIPGSLHAVGLPPPRPWPSART